MENHQRFAEKEIKERLLKTGNSKLAEIANSYESMESMAAAIARTGEAENFATLYFQDNNQKDHVADIKKADREDIKNLIIAYKGINPVACEYVIRDVFIALIYQPENAGLVARALNQQKVKDLVSRVENDNLIAAMKCFGVAARYLWYIKDKNLTPAYLAQLADSASAQIGPNFRKYMETIQNKIFFQQK